MIRAVAIDDEPPALRLIENFCREVDFIELQKTFTAPGDALFYLSNFPVDLLFLDINMPSLSGIDLYRKIGVNTMAIFTTAHSEYAVDGFNLNAIDFLLKPFTLERFMQAARKAKEHAMNLHNGADKDAPASEVEKSNELQKAFELLGQEKKRSEELLLNILPEDISSELKEYGKTKARSFEMVTVLFMDIKGFTKISEQYTPEEIVNSLDEYFEMFDLIVEKHGIEKIKTIGDAYLCVSGITLPIRDHAEKMIHAAKDFIMAVKALKEERTITNKPVFDFRVGIHSGPVVAGVVGIKKFAYDIWGDTVNTASRMQSNGEPGRINISHSTYELVNEKFLCEYRGEIEAKNKGKLKMYFVK